MDYKEIHRTAYDQAIQYGFSDEDASKCADEAVQNKTENLFESADITRKAGLEDV